MATTCTVCKRSYSEELCPYCTVTDVKVSELTDKLHLQHGGDGSEVPTAFLVDLVSNRKIPITTPRCKVGRDDLNDIVISGDQSISRFHFVITKDSDQYMVQDSKSRHGTFLNGNQIAGPIPINDGDVLKVGVSLFWFVIENQAVGAADQFAPVDMPAEVQEMKVNAGEKTTPYAPTREVDVASMTSLKEVLAQAKAKENAASEAEMSKTLPPNYKDLVEEKIAPKSEDKQDKADEKAEKSESKSDEKSDDKSEVKAEEKADAKSDNKSEDKSDAKDNKADAENKDSKGKDKEEKEAAKKDDDKKEEQKAEKKEDKKEDKRDDGLQITASMLMEALEHESLSEVSRLDDAPKGKDKDSDKEVSGNGKDKPEEAESKEKEKGKKKKDDDLLSEKELQGLFSDNNLDKTSDKEDASGNNKEAASDNNKDQDESSSDKISDSRDSAEKPEDKSKGNDEDFSPGASETQKTESDSETVSKSTLDKMADALQDSSESKEKEQVKEDKPEEKTEEKAEEKAASSKTEEAGSLTNLSFEQEIVEKTKNGAWSGNTMQDTKVPDWCSKYFASELNLLVKDLDNLNEQVRTAQNKIKEVENRLAATKSLRNTLLTSTGEDLVEACGKVLARLGFRVKIVEDDKQELRLESDDKVSICRIIWTPGLPERTHLGQLSIAQTRYWCEQGAEPKGILIAAQAEDKPPPKITDTDYNGELADYASKKNVLMFTTLQLLAMYKEVALNDGSAESLRSSIHTSNGWLKGYSLDPSDEDEKEPSKLASASA